jgi:hypothetical protein
VWGKFITALDSRQYPTFDAKKHYIKPFRIPDDWDILVGVDVGSGNNPGAHEGHPAAIMFIAVNPKYTEAVVFAGWRGDNIGRTIAGDVMDKYRAMCVERKINPKRKFYDQGCRDFKTISERLGAHPTNDEICANFEPSEKDHRVGEDILNLLFKHDMLRIFDEDAELQKFGREIASIKKSTPKNKRQDDMVDGVRYPVASLANQWNFDKVIKKEVEKVAVPVREETANERCKRERQERVSQFRRRDNPYGADVEAEFRELNDLHEG